MTYQPSLPLRAVGGPPSMLPAVLLGIGLGGFADAIVLHQLVQWHQMGSAVLAPDTMDAMRQNMRWDGSFQAAMLVLCIAGVYLLVEQARDGREMPRRLVLSGQLLLGWGLFNMLEGLVNHLLLGLHHVRDLPRYEPAYDFIFLAVAGVGFSLAGAYIAILDRHAGRTGEFPLPRT